MTLVPGRHVATLILGFLMLATIEPVRFAHAASRVTEFKLDNGMQVVVIPDARAPVVTHMVWYKVGAADEPQGRLWHRALSRAPDVQVHGQDPDGRVLQDRRQARRPGQRLHRPRRHRLLPAHRQGQAAHGDGDGGRPHGQSASHRKGSADRARCHPRRAPLAHREQSVGHSRRADGRRALLLAPLRHSDHRLGARNGPAEPGRRDGLLQALVRAEQRNPGRRG